MTDSPTTSVPTPSAPLRVVVMGVSGCGKSTVGQALAERLGVRYVEGDDFHPPDNVARMAAGTPLTDEDRAGWLATLASQIAEARMQGVGLVLACSALKRSYRDQLRAGDADLRWVHLSGPREVFAERMAARAHRYMPVSLLDSQLATLETPQPDEPTLTCNVQTPPDDIVTEALRWLASASGGDNANPDHTPNASPSARSHS